MILSLLKPGSKRTLNVFHYSFLDVIGRSALLPFLNESSIVTFLSQEKPRNGQLDFKHGERSETSYMMNSSKRLQNYVHPSKTKQSLPTNLNRVNFKESCDSNLAINILRKLLAYINVYLNYQLPGGIYALIFIWKQKRKN